MLAQFHLSDLSCVALSLVHLRSPRANSFVFLFFCNMFILHEKREQSQASTSTVNPSAHFTFL